MNGTSPPTEAVILAGGVGTRLQSVVADVPKPMAEVAARPFLAYLLDYLVGHGVQRAILSVGHKHEVIAAHFGARYGPLTLLYSIEHERLGTGGGIRLALPLVSGENVLVLNGDTFFDVDPSALVVRHAAANAVLTVALRHMSDCGRYGRVICDAGGRVRGFAEKQAAAAGEINGGVYVLNKSWLLGLATGRVFSFEKDVLEARVPDATIVGVPSEGYFIDIGIPEDYARAQHELPQRAARYARPLAGPAREAGGIGA